MLGALGGRAPVLSQIVGMAAEQVRNLGLYSLGKTPGRATEALHPVAVWGVLRPLKVQ